MGIVKRDRHHPPILIARPAFEQTGGFDPDQWS